PSFSSSFTLGRPHSPTLLPYTTLFRSNAMQPQNHVERSVPLPIAIIDGIDLNFTQEQLSWELQDFSERVLRPAVAQLVATVEAEDRKSTRLNSSHVKRSYAVFCLKKKK